MRLNPKYAAEHQLAVIDCLEDPDPTLKKKTLELLFKMAKPNNVEVRVIGCGAARLAWLAPWCFHFGSPRYYCTEPSGATDCGSVSSCACHVARSHGPWRSWP